MASFAPVCACRACSSWPRGLVLVAAGVCAPGRFQRVHLSSSWSRGILGSNVHLSLPSWSRIGSWSRSVPAPVAPFLVVARGASAYPASYPAYPPVQHVHLSLLVVAGLKHVHCRSSWSRMRITCRTVSAYRVHLSLLVVASERVSCVFSVPTCAPVLHRGRERVSFQRDVHLSLGSNVLVVYRSNVMCTCRSVPTSSRARAPRGRERVSSYVFPTCACRACVHLYV